MTDRETLRLKILEFVSRSHDFRDGDADVFALSLAEHLTPAADETPPPFTIVYVCSCGDEFTEPRTLVEHRQMVHEQQR